MKSTAFIGAAVLALMIGAFAQSATTKRPLTFEVTVMGEGEDTEATEIGFRSLHWSHVHFGINAYKASDGQRLSAKYAELRDADEAQRYFDWVLERVVRVTKKGDKRDTKGRVVGRRVEVVPKSPENGCAVMWTEGAMFRQIVANDCAHARALEEQYVP